jgi:hypothetical protein
MSDNSSPTPYPGIDTSAPLKRDFTFTKERAGATLTMRVEAASWGYPNWGLQIGVSIDDGGKTRHNSTGARRPDLPFEKATVGDALALFESVGVVPCRTCGAPAFDPATSITNRAGECESCFLERIDRDYQRQMLPSRIRELKAELQRAGDHKAKGFTHRLLAMIHPEAGGDDYLVEFFTKKEPTPAEIEKLLKKRRSAVLNDYRLTHLDNLQTSLQEALAKAEADKVTFAAEKDTARKAAAKAARDAKKAIGAAAKTPAKARRSKAPAGTGQPPQGDQGAAS